MTHTEHKSVVPAAPRRAYETPTLVDLGSVAAVTAAIDMTMTNKDGGPNNIKS